MNSLIRREATIGRYPLVNNTNVRFSTGAPRERQYRASRVRRAAITCALLLACGPSGRTTLYCNRPYFELKPNSGPPFDSVGLLNNGCTAFLIDKDHIAAAAHCFVDPNTGQ